ncbi:MAG: prepilin-type N-terminal cleavage/methylation domain-containing protein [Phycisphaerae bacterium]|jgi:prepilin-type N-terminal cleavage/methylation domain-containing protein|nr:prepilin-type N-terminal cleavage/methylation domain-containing protein [Phycisphaerae bacterium]
MLYCKGAEIEQMKSWRKRRRASGFSLLELVIVVVIMGIVAAVAIPRMSRGSAGAADAALSANLAVLRNSIDMYAGEHNATYPAVGTIVNQLTMYSSITGATNATKTTTYAYGPYLRKVPKLPVGAKKGQSGIAAASGDTIGWIYTAASGTIKSNTTDAEKDSTDVAYNTY